MLTASVGNMFVTSIDTTLETGIVPTQYIVIISTVRRQSVSDSRKLVSSIGSTLVQLLISAWVPSSCKQFGPVFTSFHSKHMKFCFQNFGNSREDKNGRGYSALSFVNEKNVFDRFCSNWTFFHFQKPKEVYLCHVYLLHHLPNFETKILYIMDTNT